MPTSEPDPSIVLHIISGPSIIEPVPLAPGSTFVGRARRCEVHLDDHLLEPHHLRIDIDGSEMTVTQLAGRVPMRADDRACARWAGSPQIESPVIEVGATRLVLRPGASALAALAARIVSATGSASAVIRPPRVAPPDPATLVPSIRSASEPDRAPAEPASGGVGLVGAATALVSAAVVAVVMGSLMFVLFALTGAVATGTTWGVQRWRRRRAERLGRAEAHRYALATERAEREAVARARQAHLERYRPVAHTLSACRTADLWSRRVDHGDAFTAVLGVGTVEYPSDSPTLAGSPVALARPGDVTAHAPGLLADVTVGLDLAARHREVVAITGPFAAGVVRSVLVQLAINTGPADWALVEVPASHDHGEGHAWVRELPHHQATVHAASAPELLPALGPGRRPVVVVTDPAQLAACDAPVRRFVDALGSADRAGVTVLVQCPDPRAVPAVCTGVLHTGLGGHGRWSVGGWPQRLHVCGVSEATATRVATALHGLTDPELPSPPGSDLPDAVALDELAGIPSSVDEVLASWSANVAPTAPVGRSVQPGAGPGALVDHWLDLVADGPHGLIAGTTGSGKSELLRTLVIALAARVSPVHLNFVLIDYKGGATFDACAGLPHTVGLVTDLDPGSAARALTSLEAELHRRERALREVGAVDLDQHRQLVMARGEYPIPRLVVIIDEFAALVSEVPGFVRALVGVAQRGRSLGVHLLLATQRPAGVIDDAIRANTDLRVALRLNDRSDALDVVGDAAPAAFGRTAPGRAMVRLGPDRGVVFQAATCGHRRRPGAPSALERLADLIAAAARCADLPSPHRPWLPPLDAVTDADLAALGVPDAVGFVDQPALQRYGALRWGRTGGLVLVGARPAETSVVLAAVIERAAEAMERVVAISAHPLTDARVIGVGEVERVQRVLGGWCDELDRRRAGRSPDIDRPWLLAIDGLAALRRSFDESAGAPMPGGRGSAFEMLERILLEGPSLGVFTVAALEDHGARSVALASRFAERWVMHLDQAADGPQYGVPPAMVPTTDAAEGSLVVADGPLAARALVQGSMPVEVLTTVSTLPDDISSDALVVPPGDGLAVGVRFDRLDHALFRCPPGDHAMVLGPPRSGRTSALVTLVAAWSARHPEAPILVVGDAAMAALRAARVHTARTVAEADLTDESVSTGFHLLVVDDAERLDDPDGRWQRRCERTAAAGGSVIAAARPDVLRQAYGHWTGALRRSRRGLVLAATGDHDADLLGEAPPRHCPIAPRPGLAWMLGEGAPALIQVARTVGCATPGGR